MIEVEVRDFQSIERASICIDGFTALVGRSNIGKSAFVRAIQAAMAGAPVGAYVRHGPTCARRVRKVKDCRCQCSVRIKADGFDLLWEKGDFINRYTFNGVVYDRANQGTPDFLLPFVAPIKVGDCKETLQVSEQFKPIFLLDQPGTVIADVLGDVAQLDRINVAMRMAEKDRKEAISTRRVRDRDVADLKHRLEGYVGLDTTLASVRTVEESYEVMAAKRKEAQTLDAFQVHLSAVRADARALAGVDLIIPPDPAPLLAKNDALKKVSVFSTQVADRAVAIRRLVGIETIDLPDTAKFQDRLQTFRRLDAWVAGLYVFQAWFDSHLPATKAVLPALESFSQGTKQFALLQGFVKRMEVLSPSISSLEREIKATEQVIAEIESEFSGLGVCPTCNQPVHPDAHAT